MVTVTRHLCFLMTSYGKWMAGPRQNLDVACSWDQHITLPADPDVQQHSVRVQRISELSMSMNIWLIFPLTSILSLGTSSLCLFLKTLAFLFYPFTLPLQSPWHSLFITPCLPATTLLLTILQIPFSSSSRKNSNRTC
jgi:hypothetical protein